MEKTVNTPERSSKENDLIAVIDAAITTARLASRQLFDMAGWRECEGVRDALTELTQHPEVLELWRAASEVSDSK